jgi:hypothetical protein
MGVASRTYGGEEMCIQVLLGKPEENRPLGRPRRGWENNIKMDLPEVGCKVLHWIDLAQDRWRSLGSVVMNLRVP